MRKIDRVKWIANFDMEDLISSILQNGMLISMGLILVAIAVSWIQQGRVDLEQSLKAESIPKFLFGPFPLGGAPGGLPSVLVRWGVSVLMLTPYVRVAVSMVYFAYVERRWKQAILTGFVLIVLTITLLTDWV
ncbi:MAG: DUF1634 domain-containing protein [Candidatus Omnitrophica bacterium]|nr:DUF1634 domain-containing protein [Candidatus Omnitrophota bacterium]